jgi:alkyl hydroperoxide reductase subunit F
MLYDLAIIGGGPAGIAGVVYAARKRLNTVLITPDFGGQSVVSPDIFNWIGHVSISGVALAESLKKHAEAYKGEFLTIREGEKVSKVSQNDDKSFTIETDGGAMYMARSVLIGTGSSRRKLGIPGADTFEHKGLTYCASCDGPLFADQNVIVVGGGNAGFESAAQLLAYCKSVTLIHRSAEFRADKITVDAVLADPKMKAIKNTEPVEVKGSAFVESLVYKDKTTGELHELPTGGIFVETGQIPNTGFVNGLVDVNEIGKIVVDHKTQRSSLPGIWAAGDCTDGLYHQNNIAAGDGVKALEDLYLWLKMQ